MDDLVQFLRAQLDEDEKIARAAPDGPWSMDGAGSIIDAAGGRVIPSVGGAQDGRVTRWPEGPAADYVLAHDPARVLREIDAKRMILERYAELSGEGWAPSAPRVVRLQELRDVVRCLALPYAGHQDYRQEWRP